MTNDACSDLACVVQSCRLRRKASYEVLSHAMTVNVDFKHAIISEASVLYF